MSPTTSERVFIIGGTGNTGAVAVRDLVAKKIPVTLYTRNPDKVASLFSTPGDEAAFKVVQGDLQNLAPLKNALPGHTRLLVVVADIVNMVEIKKAVALAAYAAGIKQIVDISSISVNAPWRSTYIGDLHQVCEQAILAAATAHNAHVVTLRPTRFLSNLIGYDRPGPTAFVDSADPDAPQGWISTNDIGALAAVVLSEDIKKHGNGVYELVGDVVTANQRAEIFTRVLGRPIAYQKLSALDRYNGLQKHLPFLPFLMLYDLAIMQDRSPAISQGLAILLGREPETFEAYLQSNKKAFE
jgi:uncharacterized protein YbjT (DUF2867 family)